MSKESLCGENKNLFTFWIFHIFPSLTVYTVSPFTVTTIKKRHFFDTGRGGCPRWAAAEERPEDFTRTVKRADFYELIVDNGRLCLDFFFFFHLGFLFRHVRRLHPSLRAIKLRVIRVRCYWYYYYYYFSFSGTCAGLESVSRRRRPKRPRPSPFSLRRFSI